METTGHCDVRSLQKYERSDVRTKETISKSLDCGSNFRNETMVDTVNENPRATSGERNTGGNTMKDELQREEINRKKARLEIVQEKSFFIGAPLTSIKFNGLSM